MTPNPDLSRCLQSCQSLQQNRIARTATNHELANSGAHRFFQDIHCLLPTVHNTDLALSLTIATRFIHLTSNVMRVGQFKLGCPPVFHGGFT
jgi:hypothetical protein